MNDDEEMAAYIRRLFGYACFGVAPEHVLCRAAWPGPQRQVLHGRDDQDVLGAVAGPIPAEMLLDQGYQGIPPAPHPDIMALRGRRLAFASETDEGRKFSASRVKWFSGGDSLTGRYGYGNMRMIAFKPSHQLFLLTNHKPHASADDFAFWERMHLIPFELSFVKRPPRAENERACRSGTRREGQGRTARHPRLVGPGVFGMAGARAQSSGQGPEATAEYRRDEDLLADFIDECCFVPDPPDPGVWVGASEILRRLLSVVFQGRLQEKEHPAKDVRQAHEVQVRKRQVGDIPIQRRRDPGRCPGTDRGREMERLMDQWTIRTDGILPWSCVQWSEIIEWIGASGTMDRIPTFFRSRKNRVYRIYLYLFFGPLVRKGKKDEEDERIKNVDNIVGPSVHFVRSSVEGFVNVLDLLREMGIEPQLVSGTNGGEYHSFLPRLRWQGTSFFAFGLSRMAATGHGGAGSAIRPATTLIPP